MARIGNNKRSIHLNSIKEELIHELTLAALDAYTNKKKNKKEIFKLLYTDYDAENFEELNEEQALDLLERLDFRIYMKTIRAKEKLQADNDTEQLYREFHKFMDENKDKYILISDTGRFNLIAKKLKLDVYTINENSHFQPYEKQEKRDYLALFIIKLEDGNEEGIMEELKQMNCKTVRIKNASQVKSKMEELS